MKEQIIRILDEVQGGRLVKDVCREHGISEGTYHRWKAKYGGLDVSEARRLRELKQENRRLKPAGGRLPLKSRPVAPRSASIWLRLRSRIVLKLYIPWVAMLLLSAGCATVNCRQAVEGSPVLEVWHGSGGFAPIMSSIRVYGDRHLIYEPPRGRVRCITLRNEEYEAINEFVDDDRFLVVMAEADAAATHYGELEEILATRTPYRNPGGCADNRSSIAKTATCEGRIEPCVSRDSGAGHVAVERR